MLLMLVKPHNTNLNPRLNSIHHAPRGGGQTTSFLHSNNILLIHVSEPPPKPHPSKL